MGKNGDCAVGASIFGLEKASAAFLFSPALDIFDQYQTFEMAIHDRVGLDPESWHFEI
jgi:hypothetical protein